MLFSDFPYLNWLIIYCVTPSILVWILFWRKLIVYKKVFLVVTIISLVWGFALDQVASVWLKVWFFEKNLNLYFLGIPLEEYAFILLLPQQMVAWFILLKKEIYG